MFIFDKILKDISDINYKVRGYIIIGVVLMMVALMKVT
jgi:hypothetical protein